MDSRPYITMELVQGGGRCVSCWRVRLRLPTSRRLLDIGAQIADGLAKAHAAGFRPSRPQAREA